MLWFQKLPIRLGKSRKRAGLQHHAFFEPGDSILRWIILPGLGVSFDAFVRNKFGLKRMKPAKRMIRNVLQSLDDDTLYSSWRIATLASEMHLLARDDDKAKLRLADKLDRLAREADFPEPDGRIAGRSAWFGKRWKRVDNIPAHQMKYESLIESLDPDTLYTPASIANFAEELGVLDAATTPDKAKARIRSAMGWLARKYLGKSGDDIVIAPGQRPYWGWYGRHWQEVLHRFRQDYLS